MKTFNLENRIIWIDLCKLIAIIGVLIDHTYNVLYSDAKIQLFSFYSVSLFIFVMGITSYHSLNKTSISCRKWIQNKSIGIIIPYLIATLIYLIYANRSFDIWAYFIHIIYFNMSAPFYYVALYLQLVIISPIIYLLLSKIDTLKLKWVYYAFLLVLILLISSLTTNYTNILSIYGGGGKLLGGNYLFLLFLGMCFSKLVAGINVKQIYYYLSLIGGLILCFMWGNFIKRNSFELDSHIPFGPGLNPPSISLCTYALLIALTIYSLCKILEPYSNIIPVKMLFKISQLGKHTLYIFLYHRLFLDGIIPHISNYFGIVISNMWLKRLVYFTIMILGSISIEILFKWIKQLFIKTKTH